MPSTFDSDSVQPLRFKAREKVKATGVTKIYQKSDPTAGRVSRTDDNVLRVGPFKFFPFTEPFRLR